MTTTADTLADGSARIQIIVAIEGYDYLLTDGDTTLALAAGYSCPGALGGLFVKWDLKDGIKPWSDSLETSSVVLTVMDCDGNDTFGIAVHGERRGNETKLTAAINSTDATIAVKDSGSLSSPVWIGNERITFSGSTAVSLTGCARGTLAPFRAGSESDFTFARNHSIPAATNTRQVQVQPVVTTTPRTWVGRRVRVALHTIIGGTINNWDEAQVLFAGTIASTRDASNGCTVIECVDMRQEIMDCVLLRDQYVGRVMEGVVLWTGQKFTAVETVSGTDYTSTLTVVAGAPATSYEIQAGLYTLPDLAARINQWLGQALTDAQLTLFWRYQPTSTETTGIRGRFSFTGAGGTSQRTLLFVPDYVMVFMGWPGQPYIESNSGSTAWSIVSPEEPYRSLPAVAYGESQIYVENTGGTWIDNTTWLPSVIQPLTGSSWGILKISSGAIALARKIGTSSIGNKTVDYFGLYDASALQGLGTDVLADFASQGVRWSTQGDSRLSVSQTVVLEGTFARLLTSILASTGVSTYNDFGTENYDSLPETLGAGIPGELLDTPWENSINAIDGGSLTTNLLIVLDKATKLWDVFKTEMIARRAHLIWSGTGGALGTGGYVLTTWSTPTTTTAVWNLTEDNKSTPSGVIDDQRAPADVTDEYAVPILKLEYNRLPDGSYRDSITIEDPGALDDSGNASRVLTLQMRNCYAGFGATGASIEILASQIAGWLPLLSRPLRRLRRSLSIPHICQLDAGHQCTVNDNFARNPSTGERGLTAKPGLILGYAKDLGGRSPEDKGGTAPRGIALSCDVLLLPTDRIAVYAPSAEVDYGAAGAGYNAGTKKLTVKAHSFSDATLPESVDASRFANGDKLRVVEQDPSNPAAPQTWTDTVNGTPVGNDITLTTGLAGFDTTKRYYVWSDHYGAATATQKAKVYQGDDSTDLIESVEHALQYGYGAGHSYNTWTHEDPATAPPLYSQYDYGDGYPLTPAHERDNIRRLNNLINYRTAHILPCLSRLVFAAPAGTYLRAILGQPMPWFCGLGLYPGLMTRYLHVAPFARNTHASSKNLIVTLSRFYPVGDSETLTSTNSPEYQFVGPYVQATFALAGGAGWASLAAQALDLRVCDQLDYGMGWLTIEGEGDGTGGIETRGFSDLHEGPLEAL